MDDIGAIGVLGLVGLRAFGGADDVEVGVRNRRGSRRPDGLPGLALILRPAHL